jgi:hypothetical protein
MRLRAGPVTTHVQVSVGASQTSVSLEPGQTYDVMLRTEDAQTAGQSRWPVRLVTETQFVPALADAGSADLRRLGVWVEFPVP